MVVTPASAQSTGGSGTTQLQGVEVTGSHIRRVDAETPDPVINLGHAFIQSTGAATLGELITQLPNVAGGAETPAVNNAGNGETDPGLRGLTAARTLLLLDGHRLLTGNIDAIPINMVDHVEILKDGASDIYGSDAIGGVINVITRKHFTGFEATAEGGISYHGDAVKTQYTGTYGMSSSKGHAVFGISYVNQDPIVTAARKYSKNALYQYYNGVQKAGGSSTGPNGNYTIPTTTATKFGYSSCKSNNGTTQLARNPGASGADASTDYHCFGSLASDHYNYNLVNYDLLPIQRTDIFGMADYKILDSVKWVTHAIFHQQNAKTQLAPEPLVTVSDGLTVSGQNYYNPFGVDISDARLRLASVGDRTTSFETDDYDLRSGFEGSLLDRFQWDVSATFQRETILKSFHGQVYLPGLAPAIGPSIDQNTCGTAGAPVANCVPFNIFGVPAGNQLTSLFPVDYENTVVKQHIVDANISGDLFQLPAGSVGGAVGYQYRNLALDFQPDFLVANNLVTDFGGAATSGSLTSNEVYAEVDVPILSKLPGAYQLTLDLGGRYSNYNSFGSSENGKYGMEYRPTKDLLVRASYADVFRVPTISNLFGGSAANAAPVNDPCNYSGQGAPPSSNPACKGITYTQGQSFTDSIGQVTVQDTSNPNLSPEKGFTTNFGLVYTPSFYQPLTLNVDFWKYSIREAIAVLSLQTSVDLCYNQGIECQNFTRGGNGNLNGGVEPLSNIGHLQTTGIDFGAKLDLGKTRFGSFVGQMDGTYLQKYQYQAATNAPTSSLAGSFIPGTATDQDGAGNFARFRILTSLTWTMSNYSATVINRMVSNVREYPGLNANQQGAAAFYCPGGGPAGQGNLQEPGGTVFCSRNVGIVDYTDLTGTVKVPKLGAEMLVGVNNVFGKNAPLVYSGFNGNTDASTYDLIGRYFFARLKVSFK